MINPPQNHNSKLFLKKDLKKKKRKKNAEGEKKKLKTHKPEFQKQNSTNYHLLRVIPGRADRWLLFHLYENAVR